MNSGLSGGLIGEQHFKIAGPYNSLVSERFKRKQVSISGNEVIRPGSNKTIKDIIVIGIPARAGCSMFGMHHGLRGLVNQLYRRLYFCFCCR